MEKVLFVDDEPNVLSGIRRHLHKKVDIETATSGREGLEKISAAGPFAVVVADMRMPNMNGAEFLAQVRQVSPDSVRMILSGQAELESTIAAVNHGQIFRFQTKPCTAELLWDSVEAGIRQYRLVLAERELLESTLSGAVKMLTELLGMVNPVAHSRASRIQRYAEHLAASVGRSDLWQLRLAGMLSQIGCISLPGDTLAKLYAGQSLSSEEQQLYRSHPQLASRLLAAIPRLEEVAEIISHQMDEQDPSALPPDIKDWDVKILGSEILRLATELEQSLAGGAPAAEASGKLQAKYAHLPKALLEALSTVQVAKGDSETRLVKISEMEVGMVLDQDVMSANGMRLVPRHQEVTQTILLRLLSISQGIGIAEPIRVTVVR